MIEIKKMGTEQKKKAKEIRKTKRESDMERCRNRGM